MTIPLNLHMGNMMQVQHRIRIVMSKWMTTYGSISHFQNCLPKGQGLWCLLLLPFMKGSFYKPQTFPVFWVNVSLDKLVPQVSYWSLLLGFLPVGAYFLLPLSPKKSFQLVCLAIFSLSLPWNFSVGYQHRSSLVSLACPTSWWPYISPQSHSQCLFGSILHYTIVAGPLLVLVAGPSSIANLLCSICEQAFLIAIPHFLLLGPPSSAGLLGSHTAITY